LFLQPVRKKYLSGNGRSYWLSPDFLLGFQHLNSGFKFRVEFGLNAKAAQRL
jgi:hypothetical protein